MKSIMRRKRLFFGMLIVAILGISRVSYAKPSDRYEFSELYMGVRVRLTVFAPSRERAESACRAAYRRIGEIEDIMSDYRPASELMRLCARSGGPAVPVSHELFLVLQRSRKVSERTDGEFDVTVGPLVALWRTARKTGRLPDPEAIRRARSLVGWEKMKLDPRHETVMLTAPGMKLDLGGIAKGYACDEALKTLKRFGIRSAMIEAGGDLVVGDPPPGEKGWRIEVANADAKDQYVTLADAAISTSGDTEQYVEIGGKRYSHVVDPKTGYGLTDRIAATVIAPDGITSDSLSKGFCMLGSEGRERLLKLYPKVKAYVRRAVDAAPAPETPKPNAPEGFERPGG